MIIAYWADAEESETRRTKVHVVDSETLLPVCGCHPKGEMQTVSMGVQGSWTRHWVDCKHCLEKVPDNKNPR